MHIAQAPVRTSLVGFFDALANEEPKVRRYTVVVHKNGAKLGDVKVGHIVSYLSIWDWCEMHGYSLVKLYRDETRKAHADERTELF